MDVYSAAQHLIHHLTGLGFEDFNNTFSVKTPAEQNAKSLGTIYKLGNSVILN